MNVLYIIYIYIYIYKDIIYIYIYIMYINIYDIYGIHHWRIIWSSYRKLAWVGFDYQLAENDICEHKSQVLAKF